MASLSIEYERINVLTPERDGRHFVEPRLDLTLEVGVVADRARLVVGPRSRHVLANIEPVCDGSHQ